MTKRPDDFLLMIDHHLDVDEEVILGDVIRITVGSPGFTCFQDIPNILLEATKDCLIRRSELNSLLSYGNPAGNPVFLEELAKFLSSEYGTPVKPSNLMATSGSISALGHVARFFSGTPTPVFISDPTYLTMVSVLQKQFNLNCVPVPKDDHGLNVDALDEEIKTTKQHIGNSHVTEEMPYWGMVVLVSVYDNPSGALLSPARCQKLIEIAEKYNLLVVSDDIYGLLHYTDQKYPPKRPMAYENKSLPNTDGHVVSLGSFSKIFAPGLRVGWIEGPENLISALSSAPTLYGGSDCHFISGVLASGMRLGLIQKNLYKMRDIYKRRLAAVVKTLRSNLPPQASFIPPQGGYFIWIKIPAHIDTDDLCQYCETKYMVNVIPEATFYQGPITQKHIRITFGYYEEEVLTEGVKRMCRAFQDYFENHQSQNTEEL